MVGGANPRFCLVVIHYFTLYNVIPMLLRLAWNIGLIHFANIVIAFILQ